MPDFYETVNDIDKLLCSVPNRCYVTENIDLAVVVRSYAVRIYEKDAATFIHSKNVADISVTLAAHMDLSDGERDMLYFSAFFHDIGKILIDTRLLTKNGALSPSEYRIMQAHSIIGEEMFSFIPDVAKAIRHHHERTDGSGYPDGLKGNEIPLTSRIIAVADSYDAMLSRPYSTIKSRCDALAEIRGKAGVQFDYEIATTLSDFL